MNTITMPILGHRVGDIWIMPDSSMMVKGSTMSFILAGQQFHLMVVSVEDDGLKVRKVVDDDTARMTNNRRAKVGVWGK